MKAIKIKGKDYIPVNERVKEFRSNEKFITYHINTSIVSIDDNQVIFKAEVFHEDTIVSTGHAMEVKGTSFINKDSWLENCETSAVGRALGFLGIGIDTAIASADELRGKEIIDSEATFKQISYIESLLLTAALSESQKIVIENNLEGLSYAKAQKAIDYLKENQPSNDVHETGGAGNQKALDKAIKDAIERDK